MTKTLKLPRALRAAPPRTDRTLEGVNYSQLIDFHRCRYRWHLKNRRGIERRGLTRAPDLGSAGHAGFAAALSILPQYPKPWREKKLAYHLNVNAIRGITAWQDEWTQQRGPLSDETATELQRTVEESIVITQRAIEFFRPSRWKVILHKRKPLIEQKIWWPIPGSTIQFYGTPDLTAEDLEEGGIFVHDYKFRERFVSQEDEQFDIQLPTYQYGLLQQKPAIPTVGSIKWQFRSQVPQDPKRNQNGSMSRQRISTTWEHYAKCLADAKLDPAPYETEMRQKLDTEFFRGDPIYRNAFQVQQAWDEITVPLAKVFLRAKTFPRLMHTWGCNGCWARDFCLGELRGEEMSFLLQTSYVDQNDPAPRMILRPEDIELVD